MHYILIGLIIGIIVFIQIAVFINTRWKINLFESILPDSDKLKTIRVYVREDEIKTVTNNKILSDISKYSDKSALGMVPSFTILVHEKEEFHLISELNNVKRSSWGIDCRILMRKNSKNSFIKLTEYDGKIYQGWSIVERKIDYFEITLILATDSTNTILDKIINSINTYLIRNKAAVSDFNLVKDIVERNCDAAEDEINTQLPIPLYLGLMGTMLGIVVGVGYMTWIGFNSFLSATVTIGVQSNGIEVLMGGVGLAMVSSFIGLSLTTLASGSYYRGAKAKVEEQKNDFYTFIQTELLPSISNSATNSIITLQTNLLKFNDGFTSNINRFDGLLTQILSSFDNQISIVSELREIDVAKLARLNIDVLRELKTSTAEFDKFNQYLHQVNAIVSNATELNETLKSDLSDIENRKIVVQQVFTKVNDSFEKGLIILKDSTDDRLKEVKEATLEQQDAFEEFLKRNKTALEEIVDKEKGLLIEQLNQNKEVLNELKKQSELRQSLEKVETAITLQNKALNDQNRTLGNFSQSVEELNKNVKKLASMPPTSNSGGYRLSTAAKYLGYGFATSGIAAFITIMIFVGGRLLTSDEQKQNINVFQSLPLIKKDTIKSTTYFLKDTLKLKKNNSDQDSIATNFKP